MILKIIRFLQAPVRVLGRVYYYVEVAFVEGKYDGFRELTQRYNDEHFNDTK